MTWWCMNLIARFMGSTWGPSGADRTQVGPVLAPWTLLSGLIFWGVGVGGFDMCRHNFTVATHELRFSVFCCFSNSHFTHVLRSPAEKYGILGRSVYSGIYNGLLLIMLHHGVSVQKPPSGKFIPLGKFMIQVFIFLVWNKWQFASFIKENPFLSICTIILWYGHCRHIACYLSSVISPVPIVRWSQVQGRSPNWSKIFCVLKRPS